MSAVLLRGRVSAVALFAALAFAGAAIAATGRTVGQVEVSVTGASNFVLPIAAPGGTNGMTPTLSLAYGSNKGSAWLGEGWSIAGMSVIARCPRTRAQDGVAANVSLSFADRYCLDASKLRLVSGSHGGDGAEYRTEIESFSRVKSWGVAGSGPAYFVVADKSGLTYEYGNTTDSRIEAVGSATVRTWLVNKIRDRQGNSIVFAYTEDTTNGSHRIANVQYTQNSALGLAAAYRIDFAYQTQPAGEIDVGYLGGTVIRDVTRLTSVSVLYNTVLVRRYTVTYDPALTNTGKSRVQSIQECAGSAGTDCFPATTFTYYDGTPGIATEVTTNVAPGSNLLPIDVNGDGKSDLVYSSTGTSGTGVWMVMFANASGGYSTPVSSGITNTNYAQAIPVDYNADGLDDLLVPYSGGTWWAIQGTTTGLAAPINTGIAATGAGGNARAMDIDGDGLDDLVYAITTGSAQSIKARLRVMSGTFGAETTIYGPLGIYEAIVGPVFGGSQFSSRRRNPDINGDGLQDIIVHTTETEPQTPTVHTWEAVFSGGAGVSYLGNFTTAGGPYWANLNGDSCSDLVYTLSGSWRYRLSNCYSLGPQQTGPVVSGLVQSNAIVMDWDGDGYEDIVGRDQVTATWHYMRSTGLGLAADVNTGIAASVTTTVAADVNGDGLTDLAYLKTGVGWSYSPHAGTRADLLKDVTDAYGNKVTFSYAPLSAYSLYTKGSGAVYPTRDFAGPLVVVSNVQYSNGIGGTWSEQNFYYEAARFDLQGRGFLGFAYRSWMDSRNNTTQRRSYRQDFPFVGAVTNARWTQASGTAITEVTSTYDKFTYGSGFETRYLPYSTQTVNYEREVSANATYNGALKRSSTTNNSVDAATGTLYDQTTTVSEPASGANGVQAGATWTSRTWLPLANLINDTVSWCIGRPGQVRQINSHSLYGGASQTRVESIAWNNALCRPTQKVLEPGNSTLQVTTDIGYDGFGNVNSQTVTGVGMTARSGSVSYGATGQFPISATNALSQTGTQTWNYALGVPLSQTDPNGISVSYLYDNFGRRIRENRPDGTATTFSYNDCANVSGGCTNSNNKMVVIATALNTSNAVVTESWTYLDKFDRTLVSTSRMLNGSMSRVDQEYDALGRVLRQTAPCIASSCTQFWTSFGYDLSNRVTQTTRPVSDSDATPQSSYAYYEGLTNRTVDALGKETVKIANAIGQIARSRDHDGYYQQFDFDAFGNAIRVQDSAGNTLNSATYNIRGMRTQSIDMDMGTWNYTPNALGEIASQTDAKAQAVSFTFDLLGRPLTRVEAEGTTTWTWGTSAAGKNIGQLQSIAGPGGISESYVFDSIGRPSQTNYNMAADGTYAVDYAYNNFGALDTLTYPTSTAGYRLKLQYEYAYGMLQRVKDFNAPTTVYWTANNTNASGQVTQETLGNGLITNRTFDSVTGWIKSIQTGLGGGTGVQNLSYQWDRTGNLSQRKDVAQNLTENFVYDNLHRLDYSQLNGTTNLDMAYDLLGNITNKSDVGSYTYHPTKKHAVASTSNGWSFTYDANGNMLTGRGQTITWTSYNYPSSISAVVNTGGGGAPVTGPVSWVNTANVSLGANGAIQATASGGVASAESSQVAASGDVSIEFKVTNVAPVYAAWTCLGNFCAPVGGGWLSAYYNGTWPQDTPVTANDLIKLSIESGVAKLYKNGTLIHSFTQAVTYPIKTTFGSSVAGEGLTQASMTYIASGGGGATNLALNKPATSEGTPCSATEGPMKAVNGTINGGNTDKWCSWNNPKWLRIDLQSSQSITSFKVHHAQAGGESATYNTRDFNIQVSADGTNWTTPVTVTANTAATTTHPVSVTARYVRLNVFAGTQTADNTARIYELEVLGGSGGGGGAATVSSQFSYGPNRNYYKQVATYTNGTSTTVYVGGLLEKVTNAGVDEYRHYIRAGGATITVSRATNNVNATYYTTQDHLGSSAAVTSAAGAVLMQSSFGPFGQRRGANWQGNPAAGDWATIASTSRRGFTDHTMLDNLSLIHMNGRVMDPLLGRFISADPNIDCEMHTQGWNRFSYLKNNLLGSTDSTGFKDDQCKNAKCQPRADPAGQGTPEVVVTGTRISSPGASMVTGASTLAVANHSGVGGGYSGSGSSVGRAALNPPVPEVVVRATRYVPPPLITSSLWPTNPISYDPGSGRRTFADVRMCASNCLAQLRNTPQTSGPTYQGSVGVTGTLGGPMLGPTSVFVNGSLSLGISTDGTWRGTQIFSATAANGIVGGGIFGGVSAAVAGGQSPGGLQPGYSNSSQLHFEANIGNGPSGGIAVDVSADGSTRAGGISTPFRVTPGFGYGVMAGAGAGRTITNASPSFGQLADATRCIARCAGG
jgi:RHS repeat-associated protein